MRIALAFVFVLTLFLPATAQVPCGLAGVTVTAAPDPAAIGAPIQVTITNNSTQTINLPSSCVYSSVYPNNACSGNPVFSPFCLAVIIPIAPGGSVTTPWNQNDDMNNQVPPGTYSIEVRYFDANFGNTFTCCVPVTIVGLSGACGMAGVTATATPDPAAFGTPIQVTLTNNSTQTINLPSSCVYSSVYPNNACTGNPVFSPICLAVIVPIAPGGSATTPWNQNDNMGNQVPPGTYSIEIRYFDANFGTVFTCCVPVTIFASDCTGDGGDQMGCTDCPCGNNAPVGCPGGCKHSASDALHNGCGAELRASGTPSLSNMDLCFTLHTAKPNSFAVLTSGAMVAPANPANPCFMQNPGSGITSMSLDGLRCVVQNVLRHGSRPIDAVCEVAANGTAPEGVWGFCSSNFPNSALFVSGSTRHFQAIYREEPNMVCGTEQNTSQRVSINFTP